MIAIGPLVLIVVIALVVYVVTRAARSADRAAPPSAVDALLARWTAAGLLTADQASALARYEAEAEPTAPVEPARAVTALPARVGAPPVSRRIPVVAEALGYLGGILAVTGLVLVVARYWPDMATTVRLALSGVGVVALFIAGQLVRPDRDPALERLRGFAWVASSACAALFAGVVAADVFDAEAPETITVAAAAAVVAESGLLWRGRRLPFQQLALFGAIAVLVGSVVALVAGAGPVGIAVWATGGALVVMGLRRLAPMPLIGDVVGGLSMVVGSVLTVVGWDEPALLFVAATAGALLAISLVPGLAPERSDQLPLGIIGGFVGMQAAPGTIGYFAQDAGMITGVAVWLAGLTLLYLGIRAVLRLPAMVETLGAITILVGAAVTAAQFQDFAPIFGIITAIGLVAAGMLPNQGLLSLFGSAGLLINVLWAIGHFFPGEGRAPLLIMVAGALILAIAVLLTRSRKVRHDLRSVRHPPGGPRATPPTGRAAVGAAEELLGETAKPLVVKHPTARCGQEVVASDPEEPRTWSCSPAATANQRICE